MSDRPIGAWERLEKVQTDEISRLREREKALVEALRELIPPHLGICCTPTPEAGELPPGPIRPDWCRCSEKVKRARAALASSQARGKEMRR